MITPLRRITTITNIQWRFLLVILGCTNQCIIFVINQMVWLDLTGNRFGSLYSATTERSDYAQKNRNEQRKRGHRKLTWKPKCGKNHGSPQTAEWWRKQQWVSTEATTSCTPSLPHAGYNGGNDLSLFLSHSLYTQLHTRCTTNNDVPHTYLCLP